MTDRTTGNHGPVPAGRGFTVRPLGRGGTEGESRPAEFPGHLTPVPRHPVDGTTADGGMAGGGPVDGRLVDRPPPSGGAVPPGHPAEEGPADGVPGFHDPAPTARSLLDAVRRRLFGLPINL